MNLTDFRDLLLEVDPKATHYKSKQQGNYTVWAEYDENHLRADDKVQEQTIPIQVDRFTKIEYDPMADAIKAMLDENDIPYDHKTDYEEDTKYIHHIFDCEVD